MDPSTPPHLPFRVSGSLGIIINEPVGTPDDRIGDTVRNTVVQKWTGSLGPLTEVRCSFYDPERFLIHGQDPGGTQSLCPPGPRSTGHFSPRCVWSVPPKVLSVPQSEGCRRSTV